jgi:hypothetical protein
MVCLLYLACLNIGFGFVIFLVARATDSTMLITATVSLIDEVAPALIRSTVDAVEVHVCATSRQWSLMSQMFIFLTCNAAVVIYVITPVNGTLETANLAQIAQVIVLNSIFTPVLSFFQPGVYFRRRAHAPYALNFIKQKSFFAPKVVDLGDYTHHTLYSPYIHYTPTHYTPIH